MFGVRVARIEHQIDCSRGEHTAQCANRGKGDPARRCKVADQNFSFDFEPDRKEEEDHQALIDPIDKWFGQPDLSELNRERRMMDKIVGPNSRRINPDKSDGHGCENGKRSMPCRRA